MDVNEAYMRRALQLARKGEPYAHPNPMVGAVIVDEGGKIIGEGYHRRCGEAHAEVNAIASVKNQNDLTRSTMYVTLEPCAHYGRTGPCAQLIIDKKIPRVVVGVRDPFDKVDGKGIEMLQAAGVEVAVGVLERECRNLNVVFFTAHTLHRPFVFLKWAQSADGWLDRKRGVDNQCAAISNPISKAFMHQWRSRFDAIVVGGGTLRADNPSLDVRCWTGPSPAPIVLTHQSQLPNDCALSRRSAKILSSATIPQALESLYAEGITSVMVEGGAEVLQELVEANYWDVMRVEIGQEKFGEDGIAKAPDLPLEKFIKSENIGLSEVKFYSQNPYFDVKNL